MPSMSKPGIVRGTEPDARMMASRGELDVAGLAAGDRDRLAGLHRAGAV